MIHRFKGLGIGNSYGYISKTILYIGNLDESLFDNIYHRYYVSTTSRRTNLWKAVRIQCNGGKMMIKVTKVPCQWCHRMLTGIHSYGEVHCTCEVCGDSFSVPVDVLVSVKEDDK